MTSLGISFEEILYAAILAFCITWFINNIIKIRSLMKGISAVNKDVASVMNRCYTLFPMDKMEFHGITFIRGMKIKVTTTANTFFEGEFIGKNARNMVCIKTKKYIIAHELNNIANIEVCEQN